MIKNIIVPSLVALVVAIGVIQFMPVSQELGGLVQTNPTTFSGGMKVGQTGTLASKVLFGNCNLATTELPLEATSTDAFTCSATGVRVGDNVSVVLSSDSGSVFGGFIVAYAIAGTDSITLGVNNQTGVATSSFPLATTTAAWRALDN